MQKNFVGAGLLWLAGMLFVQTARTQDGKGKAEFTYRDGPVYNVRMIDGNIIELSVNGRKIPADSFSVYSDVIERIKKQAEEDRFRMRLDRERVEKDREEAQLMREKVLLDEKEFQDGQLQAQRDRLEVQKDRIEAQRGRLEAQRDRELAGEDRVLMHDMVGELVRDGLISNEKDPVSIELTEEKFILNGKRQPEKIHKKYLDKFYQEVNRPLHFQRDR